MSYKLLLSCDDSVFFDGVNFYAQNQEKYDFYQRYLRVFDELQLVLRCVNEQKVHPQRVILRDNRIKVIPMTEFHGPVQYALNYFKIEKQINAIVLDCDAAILRLPSTIAMKVYGKLKRKKIPYCVEVVYDAFDDYTTNSFLSYQKYLWWRIHNNMVNICNNADGVSCVTSKYLQRRYFSIKKKHFVNNYSSLSLDKSFYTGPRAFPKKNRLTLVHVANQVDYDGRKGHDQVLKAVAHLKNQNIFVNVIFVGADYNDGYRKIYNFCKKKSISDQVEIIGFLQKSELRNILLQSDLFVLPTQAEGLPRVLIEAMSVGLPCVTTNVSGNHELVNLDCLIKFGDIDALSCKIKEIIKSPQLYQDLSLLNYKKSLEYESSVLEKRRDAFYSNLKQMIK